jgi:ABC-type amino acid transport substrate-binding protein
MSQFNSLSAIYQLGCIIYGLLNNVSNISPKIYISIPYTGSKVEESQSKDLDFFQMEKLLTWMKIFFEEEDNENIKDIKDIKDNTVKAYKKELYNIYVGIRSDYIQYQNWKKYNNSLLFFSSYRCKNTKDLSKKIISDIQLFNEGLKMFSYIKSNNKYEQ